VREGELKDAVLQAKKNISDTFQVSLSKAEKNISNSTRDVFSKLQTLIEQVNHYFYSVT